MSSVNSTKNRYSKEKKQQRSRVLTAQRTTTIILSITVGTNHCCSMPSAVDWECYAGKIFCLVSCLSL